MHSVFLPHFRVKMDAVPGMPTQFWFVPTKTTAEMRVMTGNPNFNYELACTEICGRGHYAMRFIVVVDEPADYKKWKASQATFASLNADYVAEKAPKMKGLLPAKEIVVSDSTSKAVVSDSSTTPVVIDTTVHAMK